MESTRRRRPKLADQIVEDVKRWIVREKKQPGDKLPNEKELIAQYGYSKSTVREALKALEVSGLVRVRTGPGGGAFLQQVSMDHAAEPLRNFLHFHHLDGDHIYQIRKVLEPELAASVVGRLTPEQLAALEANIEQCACVPANEEEQRAQRVAELAFHNLLAQACPNPVLRFISQFLNDLLRDLVIYKGAHDHAHFGERNVDWHRRLVKALRQGNERTVRRLMAAHMNEAEQHMHEMEVQIGTKRLLAPEPRG